MKTIERIYRILGFSEDVTTCSCCGRVDLKGTLVIENLESGDIEYFGIICGTKIAKNTKKFVEEELKEVEKQNLIKAKEEYRNSNEYKEYHSFIESRPNDYLMGKPEYADLTIKTLELSEKNNNKRNEIANKYFIKFKSRM